MGEAKAPGTPFQRLAAALATPSRGEVTGSATSESFTIDRGEAVIEVSLSHGAPPVLSLRGHEEEIAPSSAGVRQNVLARVRARQVYPQLEFRRVTSLDRVNKLFALRFDVRTGDAAFDQAVTIETDLADEVIAQALQEKAARDAIRAILDAGFTVHFEERALRADLVSPTDAHFNAATVGPVVDALAALVAHVPRLDGASFEKRPQAGRAIIGAIVSIGLVAAGALAPGTLDESGVTIKKLPRPLVPLPTMAPGVALGVVAFVPAFLLLRFLLKRRNTFTDLPLVMALLVVMGSLGVGVLEAGNRLLDEAPLAVHDVKVVGKDTSKSRKSGAVTEWTLVVPSWQPGATQLELSVDAELHRGVRTGDVLRVSVHPGFFGWEWGAVVERVAGGARPPDEPGAPRPSGTPSAPSPEAEPPKTAPTSAPDR
jgi:hypothetical protein